MNKTLISILAVIGVLGVLILTVVGIGISASNQEVGLRNAIKAKQTANQATFDNMWKQIQQTAEVTNEQKNALKDIFIQHAQARTGEGVDKAIVKWISESVPNVDVSAYKNLQNIIVGARNSFTSDQIALLDMKRAHDDVLTKFPSSLFVGGRPSIEVQIVTSERTGAAFSSGKDENVKLFDNK